MQLGLSSNLMQRGYLALIDLTHSSLFVVGPVAIHHDLADTHDMRLRADMMEGQT